MPEVKKRTFRLAKVASEFNVSWQTIVEHLNKKGFEVDAKPTSKLSEEMYTALQQEFSSDVALKERAEQVKIGRKNREEIKIDEEGTIHTVSRKSVEPKAEKIVKGETSEEKAVEEVAEKVTEEKAEKPLQTEIPKLEEVVEVEATKVEEVAASNLVEEVEVKELETPKAKEETTTTVKEEVVEEPKVETPPPPKPIVDVEKSKEITTPAAPVVPQNVKAEEPTPVAEEKAKAEKPVKLEKQLEGPKVIGKIDLEGLKKGKNKKEHNPSKKQQQKDGKQHPQSTNREKPKHHKQAPKSKPKEEKKTAVFAKNNPPKQKVGKVVNEQPPQQKKSADSPQKPASEEKTIDIKRKVPVLEGPKVLGKIKLPVEDKKKKGQSNKRQRKRIKRTGPNTGKSNQAGSGSGSKNTNSGNNSNSGNNNNNNRSRTSSNSNNSNNNRRSSNNNQRGGYKSRRGNYKGNNRKRTEDAPQISEKEIQEKIKATMAKMSGGGGKSNRQKLRRNKRDVIAEKEAKRHAKAQAESKILQVTEFITVSELASLLEVSATQVISACMTLGSFVSINQRLDAELIDLVSEEFGYKVQFIDVSDQEEEEEIVDDPKDLRERAPIVTIMGHVDHGKTSLLDYIRSANVIAGEVGGITQHIGAYEVTTESGNQITFLDTPGHEAFTAMRARGAKITDIAVIVIAADDAIMPQTKEAISHAQAADVPIIFAINKIDRPTANPEKIKEQLAGMNLLVEDWGGEYQSEEISAKMGTNVDELLEKILLVAELLELKANPDRVASGSVIEAELDKGRGYVSTLLVQTGTLKVGDMIVAGSIYGKVKAMTDERGKRVKAAGPSTPVMVLGLNGAPQAGEKFKVYESESEAKDVATKREQIVREQGRRTKKHITLEEIGRRLALENFKELNLIVKGDVDGSVEALSDSLMKLSTEEIQVNVIHKSVGQISESDVLLASASDAIIVGFQVRPSLNARKLAEKEDIDIRMYSIIYDAIEEIKSAMEGMLEPTIEEKIVCNVEVRDVFKISKVGTVAGCYVQDGKVHRNTRVRLVRDGIVVFTGEISGLKRFKDDVKEVSTSMECGISIKNYNDIKVGDIIEGYEEIEIKRTLK